MPVPRTPSQALSVPDSKPSLKIVPLGALKVKRSAALVALVRPLTVTVTSTVPLPAGLVALQLVVLAQLTPVAAVLPKRAVVAPAVVLNPVPVIVTTVPPADGPFVGLIEVIVGSGGDGTLKRSRMFAVIV